MNKILKLFGYAKIENIKIQEEFKKHPPRTNKMRAREVYYLRYEKFQQAIILDKNGYLIDGYTSYLVAKELGKKYVKVIRTKEEI